MLAEFIDVLGKPGGHILMHAAGAEIGRMHAAAGGALVEHHQLFALLEAPERRRQGAHIHRLRRDVEQMVEDAADLAIEHADILAALRHFETQQLFDRQAKACSWFIGAT